MWIQKAPGYDPGAFLVALVDQSVSGSLALPDCSLK